MAPADPNVSRSLLAVEVVSAGVPAQPAAPASMSVPATEAFHMISSTTPTLRRARFSPALVSNCALQANEPGWSANYIEPAQAGLFEALTMLKLARVLLNMLSLARQIVPRSNAHPRASQAALRPQRTATSSHGIYQANSRLMAGMPEPRAEVRAEVNGTCRRGDRSYQPTKKASHHRACRFQQ